MGLSHHQNKSPALFGYRPGDAIHNQALVDLTAFDFSEIVRSSRKSAGLSSIEFAQALGVSRSVVQAWETGNRTPKIDHLLKIALVTKKRLVIRFEKR